MKRFLFLCVLVFISSIIQAQIFLDEIQLTEDTQVSLLTSSPSDEEVFTVYGHTAIRITDVANRLDYVFNYGIFDFRAPNFLYRFVKGETDYYLGIGYFEGYTVDYELRGSSVTEQVLNLTYREKLNLWKALLVNAKPENREYRYNFFFDNCSTRPAILIENAVEGNIVYAPQEQTHSFRDMINYCTRNKPWQTFGCDLVLGSPTDRTATQQEEFFLPEYLMDGFAGAQIVTPDGNRRSLVLNTDVLTGEIEEEEPETVFFTPLLCSWLLFILMGGITWLEWKKKAWFRVVDVLLFTVAGLAGCILFFLAFISEHPCTWPNWSLVWLHPLHLLGAALFTVKKWGKAAYYYHFINFAVLTLLLLGWSFIPQHMNTAFIPLVGVLWIRSGAGVYRYKSGIE